MAVKSNMTKEEVKNLLLSVKKGDPGDSPLVKSSSAIPEQYRKIMPSYITKVLNDTEFFIYYNEIKDWMKDHEDWTMKEDIDDVNGIAMEKVIQFRLLSDRKRSKAVSEIDREFTSSKAREMVHRSNLGAKRAQRIAEKKTTNITNNVINIAGEIDAKKLEKIRKINIVEQEQENEMFPAIDITSIGENKQLKEG